MDWRRLFEAIGIVLIICIAMAVVVSVIFGVLLLVGTYPYVGAPLVIIGLFAAFVAIVYHDL